MNHVGFEVVCPDGETRHFPYANKGDADSHARHASDPAWFKKRGCRLAPRRCSLRDDGRCPGGKHTVRLCAYPDGVASA